MRKTTYSVALMIVLGLLSCKETQKSDDIITRKQEIVKVEKAVQRVGDYEQSRTVDWHNSVYTVFIKREADESLPIVSDAAGSRYYDNRIDVRITSADGRNVFKREFTKNDFAAYVGSDYAQNNVLLGVVFHRVDKDHMYFAASVGAPDNMSDEYIPLVVRLSYKTYKLEIYKDTVLDTSNPDGEENYESQTVDDE